MTVFDVFMVILGLVLIAVSFFFGEKVTSKDGNNSSPSSNYTIDEERILAIQNTVEDNLNKMSEATIAKTENSLNKVTNEKIMAITDYSDQILEKIDQNHTEVVFLYNMLNEKDEAIKEGLSKHSESRVFMQETHTNYASEEVGVPSPKEVSNNKKKNYTNNNKQSNKKKTPTRNIHGINDEEAALLTNSISYSSIEEEDTDSSNSKSSDDMTTDKHNNNERIIKLYDAGKSITEIAKELDLGKGEVTFVVNLFKKK